MDYKSNSNLPKNERKSPIRDKIEDGARIISTGEERVSGESGRGAKEFELSSKVGSCLKKSFWD